MARWFLEKYNLRLFVLTAGAHYSAIYTKEEYSILPTPKVEVKDTVGAGDSFSGALIISLLKGKSLKEAHVERQVAQRGAQDCGRDSGICL